MNIIYKIAMLAILLLSGTVCPHIEELEAHLPCPLLQKEECPLWV